MKWIAIAGGWRKTNTQVKHDVEKMVREIIDRGDGIVSGGALGVDLIALSEALHKNPNADRIKILLPSTLETYREHLLRRAEEGLVTVNQVEYLITQLETLQSTNPLALIEGVHGILTRETYFDRITNIIEASDELIAFHINHTEGTQDTINKARAKGIPIKLFEYTIE